MAVNVPVEFWDKSTWDRYFREELGAFRSALAGFMEARQVVLGRLSGDLAQVLRGGDGELALQITTLAAPQVSSITRIVGRCCV